MAYHYGSRFSFFTFPSRLRTGFLLFIFLLLSVLSWGQCFKPAINISAANGHIAFNDFNGDGKPDFVTIQRHFNQDSHHYSDSVAIFLNRGGGLFDRGTRFLVGGYADSLAVGDLNADGKLDVAVTTERNSVAILLGDGKGKLSAPATLTINGNGEPAIRVLLSDFNTDGYPDLAVASLYDSVTVLLNDGHASFGKGIKYSSGKSTQIRQSKAGDFNGDGKPDLILLQDNKNDYFVSLLLNNGVGGFGAATIIRNSVFKNVDAAEVGDFNGDGKPDLIVSGDTVTILLNNGNNGFIINKITTPNTGNYRPWVTVGDFNGDTKSDLLFPGRLNYPGSVFMLGYVLLGKGNSLFEAPISFGFVGPYTGFQTGDFNTDGQTDLLSMQDDTISVLLNCTILNTPPTPTSNNSQTATIGVPFAYTVNAFTDLETPNSLTYSASLTPANGLSFDATTRLISGTPSMSGITSVTITAIDPTGLSAATSFTITTKPPVILGVDEPGAGLLTISPNPATDIVQVRLTNAYRGMVALRVVSANGQLVRTHTSVKTGETWQHTLSVQDLPAGSYYLRLDQNGRQAVDRLLKL